MAGYTRNDTSNNIANGNVIDADDLDGEFNAIQAAFDSSTGHTHDGTSAEGAAIEVTGPNQEYLSDATALYPKTDDTYDLGKTGAEWKDLYVDGVANVDTLTADAGTVGGSAITTTDNTQTLTNKTINSASNTLTVNLAEATVTGTKAEFNAALSDDDFVSLTGAETLTNKTLTSPDINGGTVDGATIGATTPGAITGTTVTASTGFSGNITSTGTSTFTTVDVNGGAIDGTTIGSATPAAGSFTTVSATGNITVGGTVDGRDVAADGTKLDTIETNADVTDTANVTAAGALMDSELTNIAAVKALNQGVATSDSPSFAGLTVDTNTLYVDSANNRVGIGTTTPSEKLHVTGTGETILVTPVPYSSSQDSAYLIASATNYTGADTNWGTHGLQHRLKVDAGGTPRVTIDTTLGEHFAVVGNGDVEIKDRDGNAILHSDGTNDRIGIGTTTPSEKLHVVGNIEVTGTVGGRDLADLVESDPTGVTGADAITNIMSLTQAEYDAIVSPNSSTLYVITT